MTKDEITMMLMRVQEECTLHSEIGNDERADFFCKVRDALTSIRDVSETEAKLNSMIDWLTVQIDWLTVQLAEKVIEPGYSIRGAKGWRDEADKATTGDIHA